jgi:hypothetical protein
VHWTFRLLSMRLEFTIARVVQVLVSYPTRRRPMPDEDCVTSEGEAYGGGGGFI